MKVKRGMSIIVLLLSGVLIIQNSEGGSKKPTRSWKQFSSLKSVIDTMTHFDVNNIRMAMRNSGQLVDAGNGPGFEWPKNSGYTLIYTGGLWIAGKVNGNLRLAAVQYDTPGFQPGTMRKGVSANPADSSFHFYKIKQTDTTGVQDYDTWPVSQGAPTQNGVPLKKGVQNIWCVYDDGRIIGREFNTLPLKVEVQQYVYGDTSSDALNNTVFAEFKIANRDTLEIDSAYISLWLDPDIGESTDDVTGVDTSLAMAYCYNGRATDAVYGSTPPAVGLLVLRSPDGFVPPAVPHAFISYNPAFPSPYTFPDSALDAYNYLRGFTKQGALIINPTTGLPTRFMYSGDPVANTGWVDTMAEEKAIIFSFGPFTLRGGDSTMFHAAIIVARGSDRLNSVALLKEAVPLAKEHYTSKLVGVNDITAMPTHFLLMQNYPNPFNPATTIRYELPQTSHVTLRVFNVLGQRVATLVDEEQSAGVKLAHFDASALSNGVYFYRLQTEKYSSVKKMLLLK